MNPDELLAAMAGTFRHRIGPEVGDTFARTQAFMASVILEKLSAQLRLAPAHQVAELRERAALRVDLDALCRPEDGPVLQARVGALGGPGEFAEVLRQLVQTLYDERAELGEARFSALLGRVRVTLRARIDRQMEYAA